MNLVFMGTPSFAVPSLERLVRDGHRLSAVVTAPQKKRGRGQKLTDTPVGTVATSLGLPVRRPTDLGDPVFHEELAALSPDMIVVVAFRILPERIFAIPGKGIFNLHASLLPRYRGAAPIQWAILNGDQETGVTTFLLKKAVDSGGILLQERIEIGPDETGGEVHDRLAQLGADVVSRTVEMLGSGTVTGVPQDESSVTRARKISKEDLRIDWSRPAAEVHNRIRAFAPEPGAWTLLQGKTLKLFRSSVVDRTQHASGAAGTVIDVSAETCIVQCGEHAVALHEVMLEGRKRLTIEEFLRGFQLTPGAVLGLTGSLPGA